MRLKKKYKIVLIILIFFLLASSISGIYIKRSFYVDPEFPPPRTGPEQPRSPSPSDPVFHRIQFETDFVRRKQTFLDRICNQSTPEASRDSIWTELAL